MKKVGLVIYLMLSFSVVLFAGLPDLVVSNMRLKDDCKVEITIRNIGDSLPNNYSAGNASIQAVKDNKGAGGWSYPLIAKTGGLSDHNGELTFTPAHLKISGTMEVRVNLDQYRKVPESNENNNKMIRTFTCCSDGQENKQGVSTFGRDKKSSSILKQKPNISNYKLSNTSSLQKR